MIGACLIHGAWRWAAHASCDFDAAFIGTTVVAMRNRVFLILRNIRDCARAIARLRSSWRDGHAAATTSLQLHGWRYYLSEHKMPWKSSCFHLCDGQADVGGPTREAKDVATSLAALVERRRVDRSTGVERCRMSSRSRRNSSEIVKVGRMAPDRNGIGAPSRQEHAPRKKRHCKDSAKQLRRTRLAIGQRRCRRTGEACAPASPHQRAWTRSDRGVA